MLNFEFNMAARHQSILLGVDYFVKMDHQKVIVIGAQYTNATHLLELRQLLES